MTTRPPASVATRATTIEVPWSVRPETGAQPKMREADAFRVSEALRYLKAKREAREDG